MGKRLVVTFKDGQMQIEGGNPILNIRKANCQGGAKALPGPFPLNLPCYGWPSLRFSFISILVSLCVIADALEAVAAKLTLAISTYSHLYAIIGPWYSPNTTESSSPCFG